MVGTPVMIPWKVLANEQSSMDMIIGRTDPEFDTEFRSECNSRAIYTDALPASNGTGGVYMIPLSDSEDKIVFKPQSEENESTGGNGFVKEYAAYLIDRGLSSVPETFITTINFKGAPSVLGSMQRFVKDSVDAEDYGPSRFNTEDIHRVGILDVRILNTDRHSGNLMLNTVTGKVIPIDHGSAFPTLSNLQDISFEWLSYPQAKEPFSEALLADIEGINVFKDISILQQLDFDIHTISAVFAATMLLKIYAKSGKNLYEIGSVLQRANDRTEPSRFEKLLSDAYLMHGSLATNFTTVVNMTL